MNAVQRFMDDFQRAIEPYINKYINQIGAISGDEDFRRYFTETVRREVEQVFFRYAFEARQSQAASAPNGSISEVETIDVSENVPLNAQTDNQSIQVIPDSMNDPTNIPSTSTNGQSENQTANNTNGEVGIPPLASTSDVPKTNKRRTSVPSADNCSKKPKTEDEGADMTYQCPIEGCEFKSGTMKGFKQHQSREKHYMCSQSKTLFTEKIVFVEHLRSAHTVERRTSTDAELISENNEGFGTNSPRKI